MDAPKYNYGETPEEVIGETPFTDGLLRREWISDRIDGLTADQIDQFESATDGYVIQQLNLRDLLTVLDALLIGSGDITAHGHDLTNRCEALRISILAALGIEES